jgi:hypothetical protein
MVDGSRPAASNSQHVRMRRQDGRGLASGGSTGVTAEGSTHLSTPGHSPSPGGLTGLAGVSTRPAGLPHPCEGCHQVP